MVRFPRSPAAARRAAGLALWLALGLAPPAAAEAPATASDLKSLSIEELMQIDVTSVSRRSERFSRVAAALTVITQEDLRRSGVTSLPDALRLVNSLHVARSTQGSWAVSARGFNSTTADKLLVLIDGRSVYTPLFAGVFWDVQDTMLEDVERIEVIRGPGATLWGANAVNGIINIITKRAEDTQGGLVTAGGGTEERAFGAVRWGGALGKAGHYRVYGKAFDRDPMVFVNGAESGDPMQMKQGGFRGDWRTSEADSFTFQGDAYGGELGQAGRPDTDLDGGNLLGRWSRHSSERSDLEMQVYLDRTHRKIPNQFEEHRDTWDVDLQHHVQLGARHDVVWGGGVRRTEDRVGNSAALAFVPDRDRRDLFSLFAQDEIGLREDRLHLTLGTKLEHNESTGLEVQPNVRFAWTPDDRRTFWGAVSRAVRTPTRLDEDLELSAFGRAFLRGSREFESEKVIASELGYRVQSRPGLSFDAAAFYNVYDDLRSQESAPGSPIVLGNKLNAETWGIELRSNFQILPWWRGQTGYSFLDKHLHFDPESTDRSAGQGEGNDPQHRFGVRSMMDLPGGVELDTWLRWVSSLPSPEVPGYVTLDVHLGWQAGRRLELALVGRDLLEGRHAEFGPATASREEVERSLYGKATWSF
jgi:iron complex outermembrane receptor protein